MADPHDPYSGDPMMITPMSEAALIVAAGNPYIIPDVTPPEQVLMISAQKRGMSVEALRRTLPQAQMRTARMAHPSGVPPDPQTEATVAGFQEVPARR